MGFFSKDYEAAGAGISKNGPKKKAFFVFFELYFRKFWKMIGLSLVTFICCIPIITVGPAIAGMTKVLRNFTIEKSSFMMHEFWKGFKSNLKQSIPVGLVDVLLCVAAYAALTVYPQLAQNAETGGMLFNVLCVITVSFAFTLLMMNFYIFPMIVATDLKLGNIIKNSFYLTCIALKKNIITLVLVVLVVGIIVTATLFSQIFTLLIVPIWAVSFIGFIIMFNTYPMIQKYVIDPYYEERGETNPEYGNLKADDGDTVFADKGGTEAPIGEKGKKNKTIS